MGDENKSYDDHQVYHEDYEDYEDNFEIGIPIEEAVSLSPPASAESVENEPETVTDAPEDDHSERIMVTESADEKLPESDTETTDHEETGVGSIPEVIDQNNIDRETERTDSPDEMPPAPSALDEINEQLRDLSRAFESKLKYDEHKNKIIDDLHQSLQEYREGLVKKYLHRIVTDIIKIVDDMRKFSAHYKNQPDSEKQSEETSEKLHKYIDNIASDLEDLFAWEGVLPFTSEGNAVDLSRQRILKKIETDDPEKDKTVAERLRPGYEWDGKIIRPEMISAYIFRAGTTSEDNND